MAAFANVSNEELQKQVHAAKRSLAIKDAQTSLMDFIRFMRPDPEDPEDTDKSTYQITPQGKLLCEVIEEAVARKKKRVAVSIAPQHGKSEVLTRMAPAWIIGKKPTEQIIVGAYNQPFANIFGDDIRAIIESQPYSQVFPKIGKLDSAAKDYMVTRQRGKISTVGIGGSGTGKPAGIFIIDDPIKNAEEAGSPARRDEVWNWYKSVVHTRVRNNTVIIVVQTRWHEDDLIGRLCDPDHPERNKLYKGIADDWLYLNIPAVVTDPALARALGLTLEKQTIPRVLEQFGDVPMSALWPEAKSLDLLAEARRLGAQEFDALYMGRPTPEDGDYFTSDMLVEYEAKDLPSNLRYYGASDHAVGAKQTTDSTVIGCVGIDENDDVWVLPDLAWGRMKTDRMVEEILAKMRQHRPQLWWMENELISKSFGPFLFTRMEETRTYCTVYPVTPTKDKQSRARSIQGRMSMGKVHFPRFAPWWKAARSELLKFPHGTHDDLVDWLSWVGIGLMELHPANATPEVKEAAPATGSIKWILNDTMRKARVEQQNGLRYA